MHFSLHKIHILRSKFRIYFSWLSRCTGLIIEKAKKNLKISFLLQFSIVIIIQRNVSAFLHINCKNSNLTFSWNLYHKNCRKESLRKIIKKKKRKKIIKESSSIAYYCQFCHSIFLVPFMKENENQYFQQTTQFIGNRNAI